MAAGDRSCSHLNHIVFGHTTVALKTGLTGQLVRLDWAERIFYRVSSVAGTMTQGITKKVGIALIV